MQTERVTFLTTPAVKANIAERAARRGISAGEFVRLAVDNMRDDESDEKELAALVEMLRETLPAIEATLARSCARLDATHRKVDKLLRESGVRK